MKPRALPTIRGRVNHGRVVWHRQDAERLAGLLRVLEGEDIEVTLSRRRPRRTLAQNAYYRGVTVPLIADAAGYTDEELMHEHLAERFLRRLHGGHLEVVSTADLDREQFGHYLDCCRIFGQDFYEIYIPEPEAAAVIYP